MEVKYLNPFIESLERVLGQFGVSGIKVGLLQVKENMYSNMDITSVIGLVGDLRGNIAYSFSEGTAKKLVGMMAGMQINDLDPMARSGIGEFANMTTGTASILLSQTGVNCDITPPSIIIGKEIYFIISSVQTIEVLVETPIGRIAVNIGLEL